MIRRHLCLFMDHHPCDGELGVLPPRLAERRGQSLNGDTASEPGPRTGPGPAQPGHMTEEAGTVATWSWSMSVSPDMTILFSIRVSDTVPFSV